LKQASLKQPSPSHESEERTWLELANTLDLKPLLRTISTYCKTFHGRQAILSLIGETNGGYLRRSKSTSVGPSKSESKKSHFPAFAHLPTFAIIQVAESADAARQEYKLVQEALALLQNSKIYQNIQRCPDDTDFHDEICYGARDLMPPIYSVQHGRGYILDENEEDFRWLTFDGSLLRMDNHKYGTRDSLDLVDILYAEQSIKKILSLRNWTLNNEIQQLAPGITYFLSQTLMNEEVSSSVKTVWDRISNSVEIVTTRNDGAFHGNEKEHYNSRADKNLFLIMKNIPTDVVFLVQGERVTTLGSSYDGAFLDLIVPTIKVQELIPGIIQTLNKKK